MRLQVGVGHVVLRRVGELDVADGAGGLLDEGGDAVVALAAEACRPLHRIAGPDLLLEGWADHRKIGGEQEAGARAVGAMHHGDREVRQTDAGVQGGDLGIVPPADGAHEDGRQHLPAQVNLAGRHALQVHDRHDAAHHGGELEEPGLGQLLGLQGLVRSPEVDGLGLDLLDAAARADGLVVDAKAGLLPIALGPPGVDRRREGGAGAGDRRAAGRARRGRIRGGRGALAASGQQQRRARRKGEDGQGAVRFHLDRLSIPACAPRARRRTSGDDDSCTAAPPSLSAAGSPSTHEPADRARGCDEPSSLTLANAAS